MEPLQYSCQTEVVVTILSNHEICTSQVWTTAEDALFTISFQGLMTFCLSVHYVSMPMFLL